MGAVGPDAIFPSGQVHVLAASPCCISLEVCPRKGLSTSLAFAANLLTAPMRKPELIYSDLLVRLGQQEHELPKLLVMLCHRAAVHKPSGELVEVVQETLPSWLVELVLLFLQMREG